MPKNIITILQALDIIHMHLHRKLNKIIIPIVLFMKNRPGKNKRVLFNIVFGNRKINICCVNSNAP